MNYEIKQLPPSVISKLRSGVNIATVSQCVEELVLNAIDANASCIAVRLDLTYWKIQVVDNGFGIEKKQLESLGERYHTSKCQALEDISYLRFYGFRGEALASLRDMAGIMEIESRFRYCPDTFGKVFFQQDKKVGNITKREVTRPSGGTTVTILDFMRNFPVRKSLICPIRDVERCLKRLEAIALMHPTISFSLRNDSTGDMCLQTKKSQELLSMFCSLFGYQKRPYAKLFNHANNEYKVEGLICIKGHYSKELQFFYVNKRLVLKTRFHQALNSVISKCVLGKNQAEPSVTSSQSPKRDQHPIFVLNLSCPLEIYDITFEPDKSLVEFENWETVLKFLNEGLSHFLKENNFTTDPDEIPPEIVVTNVNLVTPPKYGDCITTEDAKNALISLVAKRYEQPAGVILEAKETSDNRNQEANEKIPCGFITPMNTSIPERSCDVRREQKQIHLERDVKKSIFDCSYYKFKKRFCSRSSLTTKNELSSTGEEKEIEKNIVDENRSEASDRNELNKSFTFSTSRPNAKVIETTLSIFQDKREPATKGIDSSQNQFTTNKSNVIDPLPIYDDLDYSSPIFQIRNIYSVHENDDFIPETPQHLENITESPESSGPFSVRNGTPSTGPFSVHTSTPSTGPFSVQISNSPVSVTSEKTNSEEKISTSNAIFVSTTQPFKITPTEILNNSVEADNHSLSNYRGKNNAERKQSKNSIDSSLENLFNVSIPSLDFNEEVLRTPNSSQDKNETVAKESSSKNTTISEWMNQWEPLDENLNSALEKIESESQLTKIRPKEDQENSGTCSWKSCQDSETQSLLYINTKTGHSSFERPHKLTEKLPESDVKKRKHFFLSHNSSPFHPRSNRNVSTHDEVTKTEVSTLLKDWENPAFKRDDFTVTNTLPELSMNGPSIRIYNTLCNYRFYKCMLDKVKVIGQIDNKFIACLINSEETENENLLVLFDQHAVHERIRLEHLINELYIGGNLMKSSSINPPLVINIGPEWVRLARAYPYELKRIAITVELSSTDYNYLSVSAAPPCLLERESNSLKRGRSTTLESNLQMLIIEQLTRIRDKSKGPALPKILQNVLNSQACRGAIKFGDKLTLEECSELIATLSQCDLPFQCAHGRPSIVPLLNFAKLKSIFNKELPKYRNLMK